MEIYEDLKKEGNYGYENKKKMLEMKNNVMEDVRGVGRDNVRVKLRGEEGKRVNEIEFREEEGDIGRLMLKNIG